jgi:hypothetical protein
MENEVITVSDRDVAEAIVRGLKLWFESDPSIHQAEGGWSVSVRGIMPESVRLQMNHYSLGVLDCKTGRI